MAEFRVLMTRDFDPSVRGYRKRNVFPRTKLGCFTCKSKKVKCDESRPICNRCKRNGWGCIYTGDDRPNDQAAASKKLLTNYKRPGSFSSLSCTTMVPYSLPSTRDGTPSMHLLRHCYDNWDDIFHMNHTDEFLSLFQSNALVRNSMLAITACHMRHVSPGDVRHRISEHFQQSLAIQDYLKIASTPLKDLGQSGVNILLLSATLLSILAFPLPASGSTGCGEPYSGTSWVLSKNSERQRWLAFQAGVRPLMRSMGSYFERSMVILGPIFLDPHEHHWPATTHGLEIIPEKWVKFFELEALINSDDKMPTGAPCLPSSGVVDKNGAVITQPPLGWLILPVIKTAAYLRNLEPTPFNAFKYIMFLAKAFSGFRELLSERNEKALWLYGYWFGLMCRFETLWWSRHRARYEYESIRSWIRELDTTKRPGPEGKIWADMMAELDAAPLAPARSEQAVS